MVHAPVSQFHVGDKVWVPLIAERACGIIKEERGPFGRGGEQIYVVSVPNDPYEPRDISRSESELQRLSKEEERQLYESLAPDDVVKYLSDGGLLFMLVRNAPSPIWLRRDSRGNITYTFLEGYSKTGGKAPPLYVLHGERIFKPKVSEVIEFIKSFGLNDEQAHKVVKSVGTAP